MHDKINGKEENPLQRQQKTSGSRKCNCCPYGYHLDLDFVRYCEKIANSQLLQSNRNTIPRVRAGRKKRESIESLLGISPPSAQQTKPINTDTLRLHREDKTDFSDALEKAVSDFEKIFNSSSRLKNLDLEQSKNGKEKNNVYLELNNSGELKTTDTFEDSTLHTNANNNEIRHQMAVSLKKMRQLEEDVKIIPSLQNQVKKLRWENRKLTKLLEAKTEEYEKNLKEQVKANIKEETIRHCRTIGTGCSVLRRDVAVSNHVAQTTTGTNPLIPGICLMHSVHQQTNTDFSNLKLSDLTHSKSGDVHLKKIFTSTAAIQCSSPLVDSSSQTDCPVKVATSDACVQHSSLTKIVSSSTIGCQVENLEKKIVNVDVGIQLDRVSNACASTQFESGLNLIKTFKTVSTQVIENARPKKTSSVGLQAKPLISDVAIVAKMLLVDNGTQTLKTSRKEIGINVNTTKHSVLPVTPKENGITADKSQQTIPRPALISSYSDTQDLCTKVDASIGARCSVSNATVDTSGLKEYYKTIEPDKQKTEQIKNTSDKKTHSMKSFSLQNLKKNEKITSSDGLQEKASPIASIISKPYEKKEPSNEMKGAMKVLNDNLLKSPSGDMPKSIRNAVNIVQQEWFKVSSTADANPLDVEDYLDCFEDYSVALLEYIVNMTDVSGNTAMHYAVSNGNFDVVSILLDSKVCNINKLNTAGYTCIMLVALAKVKSEADRQVVRRLFHMADVNIRAKQHGQTALMLAVSHGRIDTVQLLLESGADINIQDEDGSTALMCAAEHGYIDIVKILLAQPDCDLTITDLDGNTALNIAMEAGNRDIGVLLYAQEHFSRGSSPFSSLKTRRAKSSTPTLKTRTPTPPNCPQEHSL